MNEIFIAKVTRRDYSTIEITITNPNTEKYAMLTLDLFQILQHDSNQKIANGLNDKS